MFHRFAAALALLLALGGQAAAAGPAERRGAGADLTPSPSHCFAVGPSLSRSAGEGREHVPIKLNRDMLSILWFGRISYAEPASTSAGNALASVALMRQTSPSPMKRER